ncbi:hypothetical protein L9F63_021344 [Diploptera punctata]|uniref:Uncharacterized protein n=1 Tax=Diploptera punctata TaxID=6984 RepID=A0AAD7ZPI4_DIPPU|nr:hypothetical protein L9F63_021344 [Diploptera punctata]
MVDNAPASATPVPPPPAPAQGPQGEQQQASLSARLVQTPVPQPVVTLVLILSNAELKLQFGGMTSRRTVNLQVNPNLISRVLERTFEIMEMTLGAVMVSPITKENFVRVCRTLIHKRCQDLQEYCSYLPVANPIKLARTLTVAQPLGELLYALGRYYAQWNGITYDVIPIPAPAQDQEPWSEVSHDQIRFFRQFLDMTKERYSQCNFPKLRRRQACENGRWTKKSPPG